MKNNDNLDSLRHSAEHVLQQAMLKLYPKILMAMGPATDDGFYFDFDPQGETISEKDFPKIEKEMKKIVSANLPITKQEITLSAAEKSFANNPYKKEWLEEIAKKGEKVTVYYSGDKFLDLCRGPHLASTAKIGHFKLLSIAGAYWHGLEKNKMLTRIYGTAFPKQEELEKFLWQKEEAAKRDHRIIGKKQDLFSFHGEAPGDVFWHSKGYTLMKNLFSFWRETHQKHGYQEIRTPEILSKSIWEQSGHTKNFLEKMYQVTTPDSKNWNAAIKPMNCDGGILVFKNRSWSYRDLPVRMGEIGVVHRYESSGELHGVIRPREFTQDDAHIFCTPEQVKNELIGVLKLSFEMYQVFGLEIDHLELSTRPKNSIGSDEVWEKAQSTMLEVLKKEKVKFQINEGDGAFYGPKIDFHLKDSVGRTWQTATIQLDFAQPENFDINFINQKGEKSRIVMIHRTIFGSFERFLGILIEHYAGAYPLWLAPVQISIIPISDKHLEFCQKIQQELLQKGLRVELDTRSESMQKKINDAESLKVPYMVIIGDREIKENNFSLRARGRKNLGPVTPEELYQKLKKEVEQKQ